MGTNIVLIGAGYSGVLTAKKLAKKFKKHDDVTITLIDRNPFHTMLTELHEVAACRVEEGSIKMSLSQIFAGRKVNVKLDNVTSIDFEGKVVKGEVSEYSYDYLVLAAGSKPTFFGVEGAKENAFKLWSYEDAVVLRDHIHNCFYKASIELDEAKKKQLLNFYVVGAGLTGVEMAGELAEYIPILCEKYEINRELVRVNNVDVLTRAVPNLPEKLSAKVERRLTKMGVNLQLSTNVEAIGTDHIEVGKDGAKIKDNTSTVIWAAGIESSDITTDAAQTLESANRGRIKVDPYLRSIDNENVFVVGDNMFYIPEGSESPVPQMVENCEHSAGTAAKNIFNTITGKGELAEYKPSFHGVMVCLGGKYGVAHVGLPGKMFSLPSFLAMLSKHFINIIYFIQVLGWNRIFTYIRHEFLTIRNRRSFVGGHLSNRSPSIMAVPLRLWLGAVWLFEGIMKVTEGWFKEAKLEGFFGGANSWYDSVLGIASTDGNAAATGDAVASATGAAADAAEQVGQVFINWDIFGWFKVIFVSGKELAHSTLADFAFKIDIPLLNTFLDKVIMPSNGLQLAMQIFIVVAEILVGLALIGGLFTTPSSTFSLVLQAMFVTTTGLYLSNMWMVFAAIAIIFVGSRSLALDYYAMPALKKLWRKLPFVRKLYIYND